MTTIALPRAIEQPVEQKGSRLGWAIQDTLTVTWRNLIALSRNPQTVMFSAIQPIMFVILFVYVFGGAIHTGGPYVNFLMPGVYVQTVTFGAVATAVGLSEDLHKGLIERFRALPMSRWAVLAGRTTADLVRNVFVVVLITVVGFAVGFRIGTNFGLFLCGALLVLLFSYTLCWGFATVGLSAPNAEAAQTMVFPILFPLIFASSAFVPVTRDARVAAGVRQVPTGHAGRQRLPLADDRRLSPRSGRRLGVARLVRRDPDRAGAAGRAQVPPGHLSERRSYSSPARRRSSPRRSASGTRTCSVVSRSRTVTASSSSESKSTVTHHGVPISSWRR